MPTLIPWLLSALTLVACAFAAARLLRQRARRRRAAAEAAASEALARRMQASQERIARERQQREVAARIVATAKARAAAASERARARAAREAAAPRVVATVDLPLPVPEEGQEAKPPEETMILVVDDSQVVRLTASRLLERHRYRVVVAANGLDATRQIDRHMPDLVVTDVEMPGLDGFGLTRQLRGNPRTAHIPIVMITAADERHRAEATRAGVGLVLGKPFSEDRLLAHIRDCQFTKVPEPA